MKSDLSLADLKKEKSRNIKRALKWISSFFDIEAPCETSTSLFLSPLVYQEHKTGSFFGKKFKYEILFW